MLVEWFQRSQPRWLVDGLTTDANPPADLTADADPPTKRIADTN